MNMVWDDSREIDKNGKLSFEHYRYYLEEDEIRKKKIDGRCVQPSKAQDMCMRALLETLGYKPKVWTRTTQEFVTESLLNPMVGRSGEEFRKHVSKMAKKLGQTREFREKTDGDWKRLRARFDGAVLGLDKVVDVYEGGFSIRIILKSTMSFSERRWFVRDHKYDLAKWVVQEIKARDELRSQIKGIGSFIPKDIIILNIPELEIEFEAKVTNDLT